MYKYIYLFYIATVSGRNLTLWNQLVRDSEPIQELKSTFRTLVLKFLPSKI